MSDDTLDKNKPFCREKTTRPACAQIKNYAQVGRTFRGSVDVRKVRSDVRFQIAGRPSKDRRECRIDRLKFACGNCFVRAYPGIHFPCGYAEPATPLPGGGHRLVFVAKHSLLQGTE